MCGIVGATFLKPRDVFTNVPSVRRIRQIYQKAGITCSPAATLSGITFTACSCHHAEVCLQHAAVPSGTADD